MTDKNKIYSNYFIYLLSLPLIILLLAPIANPSLSQAEESPHNCNSQQVELFSCALKSKTIIALCLNKKKLTTELLRMEPQGAKIATTVSNLKQYINIRAHDYQTTLEGNASDGKIELFIDTDLDDMLNPALLTDNGNESHTEFCSGSKYNSSTDPIYSLPQYKLKIKNETKIVEVSKLLSLGISTPLAEDDVADWPNDDGTFAPTKK